MCRCHCILHSVIMQRGHADRYCDVCARGRSVGTPSLLSRDALQGKGVAGVRERGVDSLTAFLHGTLRQSHGRECREAVRDVGLHVHEIGINAEDRGGADAGEHEPYLRSRRAGGGRRSCAVRRVILRWGVQSGLTCRSVAPCATPCPEPAAPLRLTARPPATYVYAWEPPAPQAPRCLKHRKGAPGAAT